MDTGTADAPTEVQAEGDRMTPAEKAARIEKLKQATRDQAKRGLMKDYKLTEKQAMKWFPKKYR